MEANAHNYRLFSLMWSAPMQISRNKRSFKKKNASTPTRLLWGTNCFIVLGHHNAQNGRRGLIHKRSVCHYFIHPDRTKSYNYNKKF